MKDKELRKLIGSRVKQRRLELNLTQPYVAEKMGVTASTKRTIVYIEANVTMRSRMRESRTYGSVRG